MGGMLLPIFFAASVSHYFAGSNWIPADNLLTTISADRYRAWLTLLRDGNQNMVRLWGGGVYEPDVFYDVCDGKNKDFQSFNSLFTTSIFQSSVF